MRKVMANLLTALAISLAVLLSVSIANADELSWEYPTERENGTALEPGEIEFTTLYRNGAEFSQVPAPALSASIPETCGETIWTATVTATYPSGHSNPITQPVDEVGCVPKSPSLIGFSPGSGT